MWRRESILARLFVVLGAVPGVAVCVRNRGKLPSEKRPAISLLDEDEASEREAFNRGRPSNSPNFVIMSPGVYVTLDNREPENEAIGTNLNAFCAAIIKAVANDAELIALLGTNGEIMYDGLATDLGEDRTITGKARVGLSFKYVFRIDEL